MFANRCTFIKKKDVVCGTAGRFIRLSISGAINPKDQRKLNLIIVLVLLATLHYQSLVNYLVKFPCRSLFEITIRIWTVEAIEPK